MIPHKWLRQQPIWWCGGIMVMMAVLIYGCRPGTAGPKAGGVDKGSPGRQPIVRSTSSAGPAVPVAPATPKAKAASEVSCCCCLGKDASPPTALKGNVPIPEGAPISYREGASEGRDFENDGIDRRQPVFGFNTEGYKYYEENDFTAVTSHPLSTFSIDVDTASYANVRRFLLQERRLPPVDAVRIEECLNYFHYDYPAPAEALPLLPTMELASCPWNPGHDLLLIGLQAKPVATDQLPPGNFVFLIDSSGSMADDLPLVKQALGLLVDQLRSCDRVAVVTYAGSAGLVLSSTPGDCHKIIKDKIDALQSGGATAGAQGIELAYQIAAKYFIPGGNNRVILITDGDFNVGVGSEGELVRMIEAKRAQNIFLTVLGTGRGNYQDGKMQMLADKGNGNYAYLDSIREAQKVLVGEMAGNLFTVAKDVKIQLEFNPRFVKGYRLIGYEKRKLADRDFADDAKDAGEVGAGHQVTVLYELIPASSEEEVPAAAPLEFQKTTVVSDKLINFKLRWKTPEDRNSTEWIGYCTAEKASPPSANFRFAAAVAEFGLLLRNSPLKGRADWNQVIQLAQDARGTDRNGYRAEFIKLAETARLLDPRHSGDKLITESRGNIVGK
ncbi:MAG: VWA domain-containing protein [Victivallales bacterium]|nr:VWA domain-containing protein [Victivallales bacterium]